MFKTFSLLLLIIVTTLIELLKILKKNPIYRILGIKGVPTWV